MGTPAPGLVTDNRMGSSNPPSAGLGLIQFARSRGVGDDPLAAAVASEGASPPTPSRLAWWWTASSTPKSQFAALYIGTYSGTVL